MNQDSDSASRSNAGAHSAADVQLVTTVSELDHMSLAETSIECQHCGRSLTEGDDVVVHVSKPADECTYQIGDCVCARPDHRQREVFTLGVRELLVVGRIGSAADAATQSTWSILVDPVPVGVSAAATTTLRWLPADTPVAERVTPTSTQHRQRHVTRSQVTVGDHPAVSGGDD
ncbi:hypothetical protein [Halorubrum sp. DM2]|uniref:hypothetical protein n=1 Tax=Halorubrum sp. DM2 TaxID=2527867 RepID=UPI0024B7012A|nr:hypothetical protein [Halorubrum sp. DM2]